MSATSRALALTSCFLATILTSLHAEGVADTPENRQQQAQRYLQATSPKGIPDDIVEQLAMNEAPADRGQFKAAVLAKFDKAAVTKIMMASLTERLSAEELKALADFYGSPIGKSALSKVNDCWADIFSSIQKEVASAVTKAKESMKQK
jgi:hypothetical protein